MEDAKRPQMKADRGQGRIFANSLKLIKPGAAPKEHTRSESVVEKANSKSDASENQKTFKRPNRNSGGNGDLCAEKYNTVRNKCVISEVNDVNIDTKDLETKDKTSKHATENEKMPSEKSKNDSKASTLKLKPSGKSASSSVLPIKRHKTPSKRTERPPGFRTRESKKHSPPEGVGSASKSDDSIVHNEKKDRNSVDDETKDKGKEDVLTIRTNRPPGFRSDHQSRNKEKSSGLIKDMTLKEKTDSNESSTKNEIKRKLDHGSDDQKSENHQLSCDKSMIKPEEVDVRTTPKVDKFDQIMPNNEIPPKSTGLIVDCPSIIVDTPNGDKLMNPPNEIPKKSTGLLGDCPTIVEKPKCDKIIISHNEISKKSTGIFGYCPTIVDTQKIDKMMMNSTGKESASKLDVSDLASNEKNVKLDISDTTTIENNIKLDAQARKPFSNETKVSISKDNYHREPFNSSSQQNFHHGKYNSQRFN